MYLCSMNVSPQRIVRLAWISLVFVHLVIIAGSVVRMTGSGMGCPDWPMCFGYAIPPTDVETVSWQTGRSFEKGQMIVHSWEEEDGSVDRLLIAKSDFTSGEAFNAENWTVYDKHDYTHFNPTHTWIEFINRLIGAVTGIPVLLLFFASFFFAIRRKAWRTFLLSFAVLFMLGFEAWLGKLVVDGNLIPGSITIHMFGAMVLVFLLLVIIRMHQGKEKHFVPTTAFVFLLAAFILSLVQILIGTQVREEIDLLVKAGVLPRSEWIDQLSTTFLVHRSFSWLVLAVNAVWVFLALRTKVRIPEIKWAVALLLVQLLGGVILTYAGMPAALQPLHLLGGILLFGVLWSALLRVRVLKA